MLCLKMDPVVIFFICVAIAITSAHVWTLYQTRWRYAKLSAVTEGKEYPNNHHVFGVGYYHATCGIWYRKPWNEFREEEGYYWDGKWHSEPDLRQVRSSTPTAEEVTRVNAVWRKADPEAMKRFWYRIEISGFGNAAKRAEYS